MATVSLLQILAIPSLALFLYGWLLLLFGLLSMYSVSIFESFGLTWDNYYYFNNHIEKLFVAVVICTAVRFTPLKWIKKSKYVIFWASILLVLLLFTPLAESELALKKWARLWLDIPGGTIQPWEFFKLWYIFFLASRLIRKKKIMDDWTFFISFLVVVAVSCFVFLILPDFGSLLVLGPVSLILYWYAWWKPFYIIVTLILWLMSVFLASLQFTYVQERLDYFFAAEDVQDNDGIWWQTRQALIAVWWWWVIGKWYGKWLQKFGYIPEAQSDFIFAAFSEEVGFLGGSILLTLYFLLARHVMKRLGKVSDPYEKTLAVGMLSLILIQALVNISVNIKLLPLTGITLPFLSHGWSALLISMLEIVLLAKILEQK